MSAIIVSGFSGIGKSYITSIEDKVLDSELICINYYWFSDGTENPDFPDNYITYLMSVKDNYDIIFTPYIKVLSERLNELNIKHIIVYPNRRLKNEYLNRLRRRKDPKIFIDWIRYSWNDYQKEFNELKKNTANIFFLCLKFKKTYLTKKDIMNR